MAAAQQTGQQLYADKGQGAQATYGRLPDAYASNVESVQQFERVE